MKIRPEELVDLDDLDDRLESEDQARERLKRWKDEALKTRMNKGRKRGHKKGSDA